MSGGNMEPEEAYGLLFDHFGEKIMEIELRLRAIEAVLVINGTIPEGAVDAKLQAIKDAMTVELEYAPEYENHRQARRVIEEMRKRLDAERDRK